MILTLAGCQEEDQSENLITYSVSVIEAKQDTLEEKIELPAEVKYYKLNNLSFSQGGTIQSIQVEEGDQVQAGDILVLLDDLNYSTLLQQAKNDQNSTYQQYLKAQSNLNFTNNQYNNSKILFESGAISEFEFDQMKLTYDLAVASLQLANEQLQKAKDYFEYLTESESDHSIIADEAGIVAYIYNKENETVGAGMPVISVAKPGTYLSVFISKDVLKDIKIGDKLTVEGEIEGEVVDISTNPDPVTLQYEVFIKSNQDLRIGETQTVEKIIETYKGIILPINAIMGDAQGYYVYVSEENIAVKYEIIVKNVVNQYVSVEGLSDGQLVIFEGNKLIRSGDHLNIVETIY